MSEEDDDDGDGLTVRIECFKALLEEKYLLDGHQGDTLA